MKYQGTRLKDEIIIRELVTVHYFELSKDYRFAGERHDFWELVYADKGDLIAETDSGRRVIKNGDIAFHKPDEWHTLMADGVSAPSAAIISFKCGSPSMSGFDGMIFRAGSHQRTLLSKILEEAEGAFLPPFDDLFAYKLVRREEAVFGSEQMIKLYLAELLISILRDEKTPAATTLKRNLDSGLFGDICDFLAESVGGKITLDDIARYAGISKTAVKQLFREQAGCGACEYFTRMKIDRAKRYIREGDYNFTQIAELLGYDSIHYFSRQFRKYVNMSPTEYAGSIRALAGAASQFNRKTEKRIENDDIIKRA
ncbi:MAG: helix-turn-helix domain-containing protein [Clostridia bacterium]|nr:helix-turn-helix domain-containing protein [Clostridia bacterium]